MTAEQSPMQGVIVTEDPAAAGAGAAGSTPSTPPEPLPLTSQADLRAFFMRTKPTKFRLVEVNGREVALVVPTVGARGDIDAAMVEVDARTNRPKPANTKKRAALLVIAMVHAVTVDPKTGEKRPGAKGWVEADLPALLIEQDTPDSIVDLLAPLCQAYLREIDAGAMEAAKNG